MTSGDIALLVSGFSLAIALGGLVWNIWEKFIFVKPRVQVSFANYIIFYPGEDLDDAKNIWSMTALNMGPGTVIVQNCVSKMYRFNFRGTKLMGLLNPIEGDVTADEPRGIGPTGGGLPVELEPGKSASFYFPFERNSVLTNQTYKIGVQDSYGRYWWCRGKALKKARADYEKEFGPLPDMDPPGEDEET